MPHFLDTNILLYAISPHSEEAAKRARADALLDQDDGALSVQVLQEFYVQATRATRPGRLPHDLAVGLIQAWTRFKVQDLTLGVVHAALEIKAAHGFSYWDGAIIAAARALGCESPLLGRSEPWAGGGGRHHHQSIPMMDNTSSPVH